MGSKRGWKTTKKVLLVLPVLVALLSMAVLTGCGEQKEPSEPTKVTGWDHIQNKGVLTVGLDDTYCPMEFLDEEEELTGFDVDLANAVGKVLGVEVEFRSVSGDEEEMEWELESGSIDCIWSGLSATPERQESMALTKKYLNNKIIIMTASNRVVVDKIEDLIGYKIGTQKGSAALEAMKANASYTKFEADITAFDSYDEAILALRGGRIDCMVIDQIQGEYENKKLYSPFFVCNYDFGNDYYAVGCRKGETDLADRIGDAIQILIDNGKAAEISNDWFGKDIVILED